MRPARRERRQVGLIPGDDAGTTVVELIMAAGITLVASGLVVPTVIVPLGRVSEQLEADVGRARFVAASDTFARAIRAARPLVDVPAVTVTSTTLVLNVHTASGPATARIQLAGDGLRIDSSGPGSAAVDLPTAVRVDGVDIAASRFVAVTGSDAEGADGQVEAVTLVLVGAGGSIERTVRLRTIHPLRGPAG